MTKESEKNQKVTKAKISKKTSPALEGKAPSPKEAVSFADPSVWYKKKGATPPPADTLPLYLYLPWEEGITDGAEALADPRFQITAFDLFKEAEYSYIRNSINAFASKNPAIYRKMILSRLIPWKGKTAGFLLSSDCVPAIRPIVWACRELGITTILIPHESVLGNRALQYLDSKGNPKFPATDFVLGWGEEQQRLFVDRGYPADRFFKMGSPKLEQTVPASQLDRETFCHLFGLNPAVPTILYIVDVTPSSFKELRENQKNAVRALANSVALLNWQLLIRMPPCGKNPLGKALLREIGENLHCAVDDATSYLVTLEEALIHCDWVTSNHSVVLLKAFLQGTPAIAMNFSDSESHWVAAGIPTITAEEDLIELMKKGSGPFSKSPEALSRAAHAFSTGTFDGRSGERIRNWLADSATDKPPLKNIPPPIERIFDPKGEAIEVAVIHSSPKLIEKTQKYLPHLLNVRSLLYIGEEQYKDHLDSIELFVQWGITSNQAKSTQLRNARELGRGRVIIEDGFIRSLDIGLSGEAGLSIILDNLTTYYDATRPSRLTTLLESGPDLTPEEHQRARAAMEKIVKARVSKYNHAPDCPLILEDNNRPKILLVDQRFGDQSVKSGLANEETFQRMLADALQRSGEYDIIVKQHPDALKGGKQSYLSNELVGPYAKENEALHVINFDVNPYALFDAVDEVYVGTSGMGFEALMAGKRVHCYGAPFYAGWGVTEDRIGIPGRTRRRTLEALFHYTYIVSSRYYDPVKKKRVEVEEIVDYVKAAKAQDGASLPITIYHRPPSF